MGDVANFPILLDSELGRELIVDCVRFAEGLLDERVIRKKYRFTDDDWEALSENDALIEKIEAEKTRRIRDGSSKRERAQQLVLAAPDVAATIMNDVGANARHRLDACKVLDDFSATGPAATATQDRFIITINLNGDVEHYDKSISVTPNDPNDAARFDKAVTIDVDDGDDKPAPQKSSPRIIPHRPEDDYGG